MKKILYITGIALLTMTVSCSDFLDNDPRGVLSEEELVTCRNRRRFYDIGLFGIGQ